MKAQHKHTKLAILCGVAMSSLMFNLAAQTAAPAAADGKSGCARAEKGGKHGGGKLIKELNLTDEQKAKVGPILEKAKSDAQAIRSNDSLDKKQKREQLQALRQTTNGQLQAVLTPEQFQKFQQIRAEHKAARGKSSAPGVPST